MKKTVTFLRSMFLPGFFLAASATLQAQHKGDTIAVYFAFDKSDISSRTQDHLDSLMYNEILTPDKDVKIIGYADYVGKNLYNDTLSLKRAHAVEQYLFTLGFKKDNIHLCIGKGKIEREGMHGNDGYAPDRKVDIVLTHAEKKHIALKTPQKTITEQPAAAATSIDKKVNKPTAKKITVVPPAIVLQSMDEITQLKPDATVILNKIYFPAGRHYALDGSEIQMDQLFDVLNTHPTMRIRIEGHVCCVYMYTDAYDEDTQSYDLSINRARFVYDYLRRRGISADRLDFAGFGRRRPVVYVEHTEEEAQKNRRVELRILSQ